MNAVHRSARSSLVLAFVLLAPLSTAARAQTSCFANTGPDLVVGDLSGTANFAQASGVDALSLGISVCNIGNAWLEYTASSNRHPVFSSGLFRLKTVAGSARFEQVGTSWLAHGFFALSTSLCCACTPAPDGSHLGVGCADVSTASRQGSQSSLGPRWQVNAHTGDFAYPPANPPWSGSIARRLQVKTSDLEVTGPPGAARYFAERQAIAPDEALAGNGDNNASWREILTTVNAGDWTFMVTGSLQRERAAIRVWKSVDPAVSEVDVHVPNDGLLVLASRSTDLGGGTWHYEYALYNMNSDLCGQSFSVPLPAGLVPTNVSFHDVDYHDGDGIGSVDQSGVDWSASLASGALSWACETFAQNPNGNALRWGTLYNFRFDANAAPAQGSVTIGLFKTPGSVTAAADVPGGMIAASNCPGDGSLAPCPCGNSGGAGRGCENSAGTGGALASWSGQASLATDTLVLSSSGQPSSAPTIVLQGTATIGPVPFGDGLRCTAGILKRLYVLSASAGAVSVPPLGGPSVSARSAALGDPIAAGTSRQYQAYYRDPDPVFCPAPSGDTWNASSGISLVWNP
jgi:hypothetical protein